MSLQLDGCASTSAAGGSSRTSTCASRTGVRGLAGPERERQVDDPQGDLPRPRPAVGRVLLDGKTCPPARTEAARRVAVVAQESAVEFALTVLEMVMLGRVPHKRAFERDSDEDREIVAAALERVGCRSSPGAASTRSQAARSSGC